MSQTIDTNILIYATHTSSPFNERARGLLEHLVAGPSLTYVMWPVLLAYLRIVTHPTILEAPLSSEEAMSNIENVVSPAHMRVVGESDDFWQTLRRVADDVKPRGNLVPDAHLVALMLANGVSAIWTYDSDFRKFSGITTRNPGDERYAQRFG